MNRRLTGRRSERRQTLVEMVVLAAVIAVASVAILTVLGGTITKKGNGTVAVLNGESPGIVAESAIGRSALEESAIAVEDDAGDGVVTSNGEVSPAAVSYGVVAVLATVLLVALLALLFAQLALVANCGLGQEAGEA